MRQALGKTPLGSHSHTSYMAWSLLLQGGYINSLVGDGDFIVLLSGGKGDRSGKPRNQEEKNYSCQV